MIVSAGSYVDSAREMKSGRFVLSGERASRHVVPDGVDLVGRASALVSGRARRLSGRAVNYHFAYANDRRDRK
ncbi:hypothetical protein CLV71_115213 [Actinophytocola oryzae]|uniref:Uncharacterized protein n=1 Tax=Actinophytocola oryzae TaxID=502181 RepID=A0A4R7V343_9PSEU|nr:hypothetical protein CLV71_115213 [Actinophytocola oryzae]